MRYLLLFTFVFCSCALFCQNDTCNFKLTGNVLDEHDRSALPFATVFIKEVGRGAVSDSAGFFLVEGLCKGTYTAVISHIGCETQELRVGIPGNHHRTFMLEHHLHELKAIAIEAERVQQKFDDGSIQKEELTSLSTRNISTVLENISGLSSIHTGANIAKPVIHGMTGNRIVLYNNGVKQEGQQWGMEHAPELDVNTINSIEVVKGAATVKYGPEAVAGVIVTKQAPLPDTTGLSGTVTAGGSSNGRQGVAAVSISNKFRKLPLAYRISGSIKAGGNLHAPDYHIDNTGVREGNAALNVGYKGKRFDLTWYMSYFKNITGIYSGSHVNNLTDLKNAIERASPLDPSSFTYKIAGPYQAVIHEINKISAAVPLAPKHLLQITSSRQFNRRQEFDDHGTVDAAGQLLPDIHLDLTTYSGESSYSYSDSSFSFEAGGSAQYLVNTFERSFLIPNYDAFTTGAFILSQVRKGNMTFHGGLRYDYRKQTAYIRRAGVVDRHPFSYSRPSATIGATWKKGRFQMEGSISSGWRAPAINELFSNGIHHGAAAFEKGNLQLPAEYSIGLFPSFTYTSRIFSLTLSPYIQWFESFIYLQPLPEPVLTIKGAFPAFEYRADPALFRGGDLKFRVKLLPKMELITVASMVHADARTSSTPLPFIPPARMNNSITYFFNKGISVSASVKSVQRQNNAPHESLLAPVPPGYHLVQAAISKRFTERILLALSVDNVMNTRYRDYMDRFRYFTDAPGRNVTAIISIRF